MCGIMIALLLMSLLTGCAAPAEEAAPMSRAAPQNMQASLVESSARPLLEPEILAAYEQALRVYAWFDLSSLPVSEATAVVDGVTYRQVDMNGIENLEDLQTYLHGVFSQDLSDRLLDGETTRFQYRDVDGRLYVAGDRRDRDFGKGSIQVEAEQVDETSYSVNVMVDLLGEDGETVVGLESWSFPYSFVNERWVFTEFQLVY